MLMCRPLYLYMHENAKIVFLFAIQQASRPIYGGFVSNDKLSTIC